VNIVPTNDVVADWFSTPKGDASVTGTFQDSVSRITTTNVDDILWNVCRWNDPTLTQITDSMRGIDPASDEYAELWQEAEARMVETAVSVNIVHGVETYAWNDERVGNFSSYPDTLNGERRPNLRDMYIKA
jgi:ABC-type transport system substrate-binding protein